MAIRRKKSKNSECAVVAEKITPPTLTYVCLTTYGILIARLGGRSAAAALSVAIIITISGQAPKFADSAIKILVCEGQRH